VAVTPFFASGSKPSCERHARAGDFLGTPAVAAFADPADDTRTGPSGRV